MSESAENFKTQGNGLYKEKKFPEAIAAYNAAIDAYPFDMTYWNNKAAAQMEAGNLNDAVNTLKDALSRKSDIYATNKDGANYEKVCKVYCRLGAVYLKLNSFDEAVVAYQKALTENNDKNTRNLLREAEAARDKWVKESYINPEIAEKHRERGNQLFKECKYADAKSEYDEAIKRNPTDAKLYSNRAATFTKLAAYPDALKDLEECLRIDPTFIKAYSRKGAALFFMKDYNKALAAYEAGLKIDAQNSECLAGRQQVIAKISSSAGDDAADPEQVQRAMADPEIQQILRDPQINIILQHLQTDPKKAMDSLKDPKVANAIQKLVAAGILKMR